MLDFFTIYHFGWPYLRRYWLRFVLGIAFGFAFGISNGLTLGGIYLMLGRLGSSDEVTQKEVQVAVDQVATDKTALLKHPADPAAAARLANDQLLADKLIADKNVADSVTADQLAADKLTAQKDAAAKNPGQIHHTIGRAFKRLQAECYLAIDPWLPRAQRAMDWKQILGGLLIIPLLAAFRGLMGYATTYLMAWAGQRITNDVKEDVFRKINTLSLDFFHKTTTAELMSRINDDTGALGACLRLGLSDLIKEPSTIVVLFCSLLYLNWKLTLIAIVFAPLCLIPMNIVRRKIKGQGRADNVSYILQAGLAMESFQNVRVTKAYELADEHAKRFSDIGRRAGFLSLKMVQARATLNPVVETLNSFGMGAVLLYAIWSGISIKILGTFLFALVNFFTPIKKLGSVGVYFTTAGMALERLMSLLALKPTVREAENPVAMTNFTRDIAFRDVCFSYGDGPVIENLSFDLKRGQRIGLAGESGSGKSSLLNLLFRF
jgi:ABC-type multidrug transport system fused ATPase/permease subunit